MRRSGVRGGWIGRSGITLRLSTRASQLTRRAQVEVGVPDRVGRRDILRVILESMGQLQHGTGVATESGALDAVTVEQVRSALPFVHAHASARRSRLQHTVAWARTCTRCADRFVSARQVTGMQPLAQS